MRARALIVVIAALAGLGLARGPAHAGKPEVVVGLGSVAAVENGPGGGGVSLALSLLWPIEQRFRVGLMAFADDMGDRTGALVGPGGENLGTVSQLHRDALGAAWRMEAHAASGGFVAPFIAATWGYYRLSDDVRGDELQRVHVAGFGLGAGVTRSLSARHAASALLRYQQLSRGSTERYLSAALEWRWGPGTAGAAARPSQ
jgi:hypothetical protein